MIIKYLCLYRARCFLQPFLLNGNHHYGHVQGRIVMVMRREKGGEGGCSGCHFVSSLKRKGAPVKGAKTLPRNLSETMMSRQLRCDKIHSFHSATRSLLVTIVSLMPNWRRCLISTEWVKRARCFEPWNHTSRVKGASEKHASRPLWCPGGRGQAGE